MVEAWYMDESQEDQRAPHRLQPNRAVSLEQLRRLGVVYRKLDADNYETDPCLKEIRRAENYSWMDIITIHKDKLPNYEEKNYIKAMRLFVGEPVWTPYNRPADDFPARKQYMKFLAEEAQ